MNLREFIRSDRWRAGWRAEKGQSLAVLAVAMVALLSMSALLVDGGMAYTQRRVAQNAADAGALAGARTLALGGNNSQVIAAVTEYTHARNHADTFSFTYFPVGTSPGNGAIGVKVTANVRFNTTFAQFLGYRNITVSAPAIASFGAPREPGPNVQPLARRCEGHGWDDCWNGFQYGHEYDIWEGEGSGNFGWLGWNGAVNATYIADELTPGHQVQYVDPHDVCARIAIGCWVQGAPGVSNSNPIGDSLDSWITTGDRMTIIIYDESEGSGSSVNYRVAGFAAFEVTSYDLPHGEIRGRFLQWVTSAPVDDGVPGFGLSGVHLRGL